MGAKWKGDRVNSENKENLWNKNVNLLVPTTRKNFILVVVVVRFVFIVFYCTRCGGVYTESMDASPNGVRVCVIADRCDASIWNLDRTRTHEYHFYRAHRLDGWMDGWMTGWEKFVCNKLIIVKFYFRLKCFSVVSVVRSLCRRRRRRLRVVFYAGMPFGYIWLFVSVKCGVFRSSYFVDHLFRWNRQRKQHMSLDWCPAKTIDILRYKTLR